MHLGMRWGRGGGGGTRRRGSWVHERVEEGRGSKGGGRSPRQAGREQQGGGLKEKNYSRDALLPGLDPFFNCIQTKVRNNDNGGGGGGGRLLLAAWTRREMGERELKKRNKRKDSEGMERGLSPEEMIKKHVWRRHKPRNVYVTCLSLSLFSGWNVKYVGQGRAREHRVRFLSLSFSFCFSFVLFLIFFVRLFAFPISPSPPFLHIPPISQFPPPPFFFIFFFFFILP